MRCVEPERVATTRERLIGAGEAEALADIFKLLGDANRVRILYALLEAGELCVCDLFRQSSPTASAPAGRREPVDEPRTRCRPRPTAAEEVTG